MPQKTMTKPVHNHTSMDVKPLGQCPACDRLLVTMPTTATPKRRK